MGMRHGIMFHHFHGGGYPVQQGSVGADELERMIEEAGKDLVSADKWLTGRGIICLSFDDMLKSQFEIALPVLRHYKLTAFWFVNTSGLEGNTKLPELYRMFRCGFSTMEKFYAAFEKEMVAVGIVDGIDNALREYDEDTYLKDFPFYTAADKKFRYLRDMVVKDKYYNIMDAMIESHGFKLEYDSTWMSGSDLNNLAADGHVIGLHSHNHPTTLGTLPIENQLEEYRKNVASLSRTLSCSETAVKRSMSHPCNSYTQATLGILCGMRIDMGFRSNMAPVENRTRWECPREDCANIKRNWT